MMPSFKDEQSKKEYIDKMTGVLVGTEMLVKETREKIQNGINDENVDNLINTLEHLGSCLFSFSNVSQMIMGNSEKTSICYPTYEERQDMLELLYYAYAHSYGENDDKTQLESRRSQKVKFINEAAKKIGMSYSEFKP